ncbi:hypothetical protein [Mariniradius sediminis]|uniref:Uncharacterized protein n=1 Tax=Mariniradius sediminis TaxID=2909237 RepID=A0ABS9BSJ0_9BACT|nr:hypothetical protein [Mariniradius sediminis]MCF1751046.1 hypothetical protein [Mariniradius sediminis]
MLTQKGLFATLFGVISLLFALLSSITAMEEEPIRLIFFEATDHRKFEIINPEFNVISLDKNFRSTHLPVQNGDLIIIRELSNFTIQVGALGSFEIYKDDTVKFVPEFANAEKESYNSVDEKIKGWEEKLESFHLIVGKDFPDHLRIKFEDSLLLVNDKVWGIDLSALKFREDFSFYSKNIDLQHLKTVTLVLPLDSSEKDFLKTLSDNNPQIDFQIKNLDSIGVFNEDLRWISVNFQPRYLGIENGPDSLDFRILQSMQSMEFLSFTEMPIPIQERILPPMPQVKSMMVMAQNDFLKLNFDFYSQNKQMEKLLGLYSVGTEIHSLSNLTKLTIADQSFFPRYNFNLRHPKLLNLNLAVADPTDNSLIVSDISNLERLRWLSIFYRSDSLPFDLAELAETHPQLQLLCLQQQHEYRSSNYAISLLSNHSALKDFSELEYLLIQDETGGIASVIMQMPHLKYLSMPEDYLNDSLRSAKLRKALPNTIISANSGFCLGSGWLLLLLPLSLLAFLIQRSFFQVSLGKS